MQTGQKQPDMNKIADIIQAADRAGAEPVINPVLKDLLDVMTPESRKELKTSIQAEGIRDAIVIWKEENTIIDGHNRFEISKELGLSFDNLPKIEMSFPNIHAVKEWMIRNQLGRRNLTPNRFEYYIGTLYNELKQDPTAPRTDQGGVTTAKTIADTVGVSERTVRRAAEQAVGIDALERVKGRLAKLQHLDGKGEYNKDEIAAIGSASSTTVAKKVVEKIDKVKNIMAEQKKQAKVEQKKVDAAAQFYPVIFMKPDWEAMGFNPTLVVRPPLEKEGIVYMYVPDENLADAIKMIDRWGLRYEASFVYHGAKTYDGVFTKIAHTFMVLATKGVVIGPKAGKEAKSVNIISGELEPMMIKQIDAYHPTQRKLDMRKNGKVHAGWDGLPK